MNPRQQYKLILPESSLDNFTCGESVARILIQEGDYKLTRRINAEVHAFYEKLKALEKVERGYGYFVQLVLEQTNDIISKKHYPDKLKSYLLCFFKAVCKTKIKHYNLSINNTNTRSWCSMRANKN